MITYQYQLLRYIHDRVSGEFVNVGVVVFEPTTRFLKAKVVTRFSRISQFFSDISGHYLLQTLRNIEREVNNLSISLSDGLTSDTHLRTLTTQFLPNSDNAFIFMEVLQGIDISPQAAFDDLFAREEMLLSKVVLGGERLFSEQQWSHNPPVLLSVQETQEVAQALAAVPVETIRERYQPEIID